MRRGLAWIVCLLALLAGYAVLQRESAPVGFGGGAGDARTATSPASDSGRGSPQVLDGAFPGRTAQPDRAYRTDAFDTAGLPAEARDTLRRIVAGGPHPYRQDGGTFGNRERLLPERPRGWYREYTVDTPRSRDRGARRIVSGGDPPREFFYTDDHYRSFRRIDAGAEGTR